MKKHLYLLSSLCILFTIGCAPQSTTTSATNQESTEISTAQDSPNQFGQPITEQGAMSYDNLLAQMKDRDSLAVKVVGTVDAVCQAKGCWMTIVSEQVDAESMMVKFKDYGFFVPKDISGRKVVMEGYAFREVTPVDELRHLAEDAGKSPEEIAKITSPKVELKFLASGVLLLEDAD